MRIEKNIIEKVANGETFMTGEPVENAKTILKPEVWSSFKRYAFFYEGDDDNLNDIQDCILDFPIQAAEITIMEIPKDVHPGERLKISGMLPKYSLEKLFWQLTDDDEKRELCEEKPFKIRGVKGKFKVLYTALQYCFEEERISVKQCLDMMRI